jgi:adenylate kinase
MNNYILSFSTESNVIILLGAPGSGKGTHAYPLSYKLNLPHISTGDLFRYNLKQQTALGLKSKQFIDNGELVPDNLVLDILLDRILKTDCKNGYVLDGFPRTYDQAKALEKMLNIDDMVKVVYLKAPDSTLIERITGRLSCISCGLIYHKIFSPPKQLFRCDECLSDLNQRKDDTKEVVLKRLSIYHAQTKPLIEYYKAKDILFEIDAGNQKSKDEIFEEIELLFKKPSFSI